MSEQKDPLPVAVGRLKEDEDRREALEASMPTVAGHKLSVEEWTAFEAYAHTGKLADAAEAAGVPVSRLRRQRRTDWWKELEAEYIESRQQGYLLRIMNASDDFAEGLVRVAQGDESLDPRLANAMVGANKLFAEMGEKPVIDRKTKFVNNNNTLNNYGRIDVNRLGELSPQQQTDLILHGTVPDALTSGE